MINARSLCVMIVALQVVAGKNYKIVIDLATQEQKVQAYEATIYGGSPLRAQSSLVKDSFDATDRLTALQDNTGVLQMSQVDRAPQHDLHA